MLDSFDEIREIVRKLNLKFATAKCKYRRTGITGAGRVYRFCKHENYQYHDSPSFICKITQCPRMRQEE